MNRFNPNIHHRHTIRLKGYDYSQSGLYYITICCHVKMCYFGDIENKKMILNDIGEIAYNEWIKLPKRYFNVSLDIFQIMPNHIHGIIILNNTFVGAGLAPAQNNQGVAQNKNTIAQNENTVTQNKNVNIQNYRAGTPDFTPDFWAGASPAPTTTTTTATIGNIVGTYKSMVANQCLEIYKLRNEYMGKLWQRNYYEHIIRNEESCQHIINYIIDNPANWERDIFFTGRKHRR